jgi:pimeloyl-ACP methyl ester carboxylesterase
MKLSSIYLIFFISLFGFSYAEENTNNLEMNAEQNLNMDRVQTGCCNKNIRQRSGFVNNNGVNIFFTDTGSRNRPTIVLIHPFPYSSCLWICQIQDLSKFYRVVTLDLRGYGRSDKTPGLSYTVPAFVSDVRAVIQSLGIQNPILVGSSIGSVIAQTYVATFQDVSKLILISPYVQVTGLPLGLDPASVAEVRAGILANREAQITGVIEATTPEGCEQIPKIRRFLLRLSNLASTEALIGTIDQAFPFSTQALLPSITIPTLIMFGGQDPIMNRLGVYFLRDNIVNSRLVEFPGGHVFNLTQSQNVDRLILEFIRQDQISECPTCF